VAGLSNAFGSFSIIRYMLPNRSAPKDGDNVTETDDLGPGKSYSIESARYEP